MHHFCTTSRLLGIPILHSVVLAVVHLLNPEWSWGSILAWFLWLPVLAFLFTPKIAAIVGAGALPFLVFAMAQ